MGPLVISARHLRQLMSYTRWSLKFSGGRGGLIIIACCVASISRCVRGVMTSWRFLRYKRNLRYNISSTLQKMVSARNRSYTWKKWCGEFRTFRTHSAGPAYRYPCAQWGLAKLLIIQNPDRETWYPIGKPVPGGSEAWHSVEIVKFNIVHDVGTRGWRLESFLSDEKCMHTKCYFTGKEYCIELFIISFTRGDMK